MVELGEATTRPKEQQVTQPGGLMSGMSAGVVPRVSIGLPVYNGENFVEAAIQSVLSQDFSDLEVIISDNASVDRTEEICRKYADEDDRVRYIRRPRNIGAGPNFNFVLELARGEYFKWMAHDDVCRPAFVSRCVAVLDADPTVVLAYPSPVDIDDCGRELGPRDRGLQLDQPGSCRRFKATMTQGHAVLAQFGVVRTDVLRATTGLGSYTGSDRPLLAELALRGRLTEIPEELFLHREHRDRSVYAQTDADAMREWWDPSRSGGISLPTWHRFADYLKAIIRAPISQRDRLCCLLFMVRWAVDIRSQLMLDFVGAAGHLARTLRAPFRTVSTEKLPGHEHEPVPKPARRRR